MRLIDADKLHYIKVCIANGYDDVKRDVVVFAKEIDKLAKKTECFGKWIPCSEMMPDKELESYIVWYENEKIIDIAILHNGELIPWYSYDIGMVEPLKDDSKPSHWMSIPEPPKEE